MAIKNIDMVFVLDVTGNMGFFVDRFRRNLLPMLRQRLSDFFSTPVQMSLSANGKGKISIPFANEKELEQIINMFDKLKDQQ